MKIEKVAVGSLSLDPANVRAHGSRNLDAIMASLRRFGQQKPIVVDSNSVVRAGNGTLESAIALGWKTIDVVKTGLVASEATAFSIADNRTAELGEWDGDQLQVQLLALQDEDETMMADLAFTVEELESLTGWESKGLKEVPPVVPPEPITKAGDLWELGTHRLLCGDATNESDVRRLMSGKMADLWITDPPYNVEANQDTEQRLSNRNRRGDGKTVGNDHLSRQDFETLLDGSFGPVFGIMNPGAAFYIWHSHSNTHNFFKAVENQGEEVRQVLIWNKHSLVMTRQDYQWKHEPCLYGWRKGASHHWYSDRKQPTVLEFDRPSVSVEHPTMKPVAMISYQMSNSSREGDVVVDTFIGSGTTMICAEQLGRTCYGMELDASYCDVVVQRWETLTGKKATLSNEAK